MKVSAQTPLRCPCEAECRDTPACTRIWQTIEGLTWDAVAKERGVALRKLLVCVARGVPGPGNAGNLRDAAAAQLVQHERSVVVLLCLLVVGLDAAHKVQLRSALPWALSRHAAYQASS